MMDQNLFVIYEDLCSNNVHEYKKKKLCKENMELKKSLEFLHHMQELKTEVAQIKNMNKNNYSQSAFDGAVANIFELLV